jgi:hypothetical protein
VYYVLVEKSVYVLLLSRPQTCRIHWEEPIRENIKKNLAKPFSSLHSCIHPSFLYTRIILFPAQKVHGSFFRALSSAFWVKILYKKILQTCQKIINASSFFPFFKNGEEGSLPNLPDAALYYREQKEIY